MKSDIIKGMLFISAIALSSCATTQLASQTNDAGDDVYYSKAKAGDVVVYAAPERSYKTDEYADEQDYGSSYFYDDSYAFRINRFNYYTPWRSYYDNLWMSSGYYNSAYLYGGMGMGFGLGYAYSPWGASYSPFYAYGYSPYGYSPYSYYGGGYGYGGGNGYWGPYSYYRQGYINPNYGPRPARGSENAIMSNADRNNGTVRIGPDGRTTVIRGTRPAGSATTPTSTTRPARTSTTAERPTRTETARPERTNNTPAPRATTVERSAPSPSPSSSGGSRGGGGSSSGGRPSRSGGGR